MHLFVISNCDVGQTRTRTAYTVVFFGQRLVSFDQGLARVSESIAWHGFASSFAWDGDEI